MTDNEVPIEQIVGRNLRQIRQNFGITLRTLAELSGLNVNTLSLIENGKTSPSVGTLRQLASVFNKPISSFFEGEPERKKSVVICSQNERLISLGNMQLRNLGRDFLMDNFQSFFIQAQPGAISGNDSIVHSGIEFIYCLEGSIRYILDHEHHDLKKNESLLFTANLRHSWEVIGENDAQFLLLICSTEMTDEPDRKHFLNNLTTKERSMKIAVITEDGKSISQHFGRAPYYLVATIEQGKIVNKELREKLGHGQFSEQHNATESGGSGHGMDAASHNKHLSMADAIADCEALICGGMGMGAYESMRRLNIKPVVTQLREMDKAIQAYIDGELVDETELLH